MGHTEPNHQPVMIAHRVLLQCRHDFRHLLLCFFLCESGNLSRVRGPLQQRFQHQLPGNAKHVGKHVAQLYIGIFQNLADSVFAPPRRVRSRSSRCRRGGMKLGVTMPCRSRCASQHASLLSVLRPRRAFTSCGLASGDCPWRTLKKHWYSPRWKRGAPTLPHLPATSAMPFRVLA
jgi:hypothetical protein